MGKTVGNAPAEKKKSIFSGAGSQKIIVLLVVIVLFAFFSIFSANFRRYTTVPRNPSCDGDGCYHIQP